MILFISILKIIILSNISIFKKNKNNNRIIKFNNSVKKPINKQKKLLKSKKYLKLKNCQKLKSI